MRQLTAYRGLLLWVSSILQRLPARCTPLLLMDANAHVGSAQACTPDGLDLVGCVAPQRENAAGGILRAWLEQHRLCLLNTVLPGGCGPTWQGHMGRCSRVDFIAMPLELTAAVDSVRVMRRKAAQLQARVGQVLLDHSPVVARWRHRTWFEAPAERPLSAWISTIQEVFLADPELESQFCDAAHAEVGRLRVDDMAEDLVMAESLDAFWEAWQEALRRAVRQVPRLCCSVVRRWTPECDQWASTERQARVLAGSGMRTVLLPVGLLAPAMEAAGIVRHPDGQPLGPEASWMRAVALALETADIDLAVKAVLDAHATTVSDPSELKDIVNIVDCRRLILAST